MNAILRIALAMVAASSLAGCLAPQDQRPGLRLTGEPTALPTDWSFTDAHKEIALQVRAPYLLPHSVTIWCAALDGQLYVAARDPETKRWPGWVDRRPDVRLRIGDAIYPVRLTPLEDPNQVAQARGAYSAKYRLPNPPPPGSPPLRYWRVAPQR